MHYPLSPIDPLPSSTIEDRASLLESCRKEAQALLVDLDNTSPFGSYAHQNLLRDLPTLIHGLSEESFRRAFGTQLSNDSILDGITYESIRAAANLLSAMRVFDALDGAVNFAGVTGLAYLSWGKEEESMHSIPGSAATAFCKGVLPYFLKVFIGDLPLQRPINPEDPAHRFANSIATQIDSLKQGEIDGVGLPKWEDPE